jgi:hypothetical protein
MVVPVHGPLVEGPAVGQNPYTDPPPMNRRRFLEDPVPRGDATEAQVLQGRGAPPPYPADAKAERRWDPRRYPDQMDVPRPSDSPQPSEWESSNLTLAQLIALPQEEQERILREARESSSIGRVPEYQPTRATIEAEDRRLRELERVRLEQEQRMNAARASSGVPSMGPATQGTVLAGEGPQQRQEHDTPPKPAEPEHHKQSPAAVEKKGK